MAPLCSRYRQRISMEIGADLRQNCIVFVYPDEIDNTYVGYLYL